MIALYRIYAFETIIHYLYVGGIFLSLFKIGGTQFISRWLCFLIDELSDFMAILP